MAEFSLDVEDKPRCLQVTLPMIVATLNRMTPLGGPSFLILESSTRDYVQAAGGQGVFTVEWRENFGEGFCHWKAGLPGVSVNGEAKVKTNGFHVSVQANEVLAASHAAIIFESFLRGDTRPSAFAWCDMTGEMSVPDSD